MYNDEQLQNSQDSYLEKTWCKTFTHRWTEVFEMILAFNWLFKYNWMGFFFVKDHIGYGKS